MDLDRQEVPPPRGNEPPQRVPELRPTLLGDWFIYLSVIVLFCGVIAITALELGQTLDEPIVRYPAIVGAALTGLVATDGAVRTYRSAWAWWPIHRGRAIQRVVWTVVLGAIALGGLWLVLKLLVIERPA